MNFFEQELNKIMAESAILKEQKYVGRSCYGAIGEDLRARIEFVTLGTCDHYAGLKTTIFNRKEGMIDSMVLRFTDIWGKPKVNNPNFRDGINPHIWTNGGKSEWYVFQPVSRDYQKIACSVEKYLSVFQDMDMVPAKQENGMQMKT